MRRLGLPFLIAVSLVGASPAAAATFTVTGNGDSTAFPPCGGGTSCPSIREALAAAETLGGADTIVIPPGDTQLSSAGHLQVDSPVTIVGAGARSTRIFGTSSDRVFNVGGTTATISSLTMSGGTEPADTGGNILNTGNLLLDHVRVTDGTATSGGGVANSAGTLSIQYSLIDDNRTSGSGALDGGGILNSAGSVTVRDSTITGNFAVSGGGVFAGGSTVTTLQRVTIARNAVSSDGGGVSVTPGQPFTVEGSIIAANTGDSPGDQNCPTAVPTSLGGNVVSTSQCNFSAVNDIQDADPQLSATLVPAGGQTDVFTIPATSPAFDRVPRCSGADQRDLGRPQGPACDSGAYEIDQAPDTVVGGTPPTFTFSSPEPGVTFQCRLEPAAFAPCTSPITYSGLAPGAHTFSVRAIDGSGNVDPTPAAMAFTVQPPQPQFHKTVVVRKVRGTVRVRAKGKRRFVALSAATGIPLGSTVDTRNGVVELTSKPGRNAKAQKAKFYDGIFKVTQPGRITQLALTEKLAKCRPGQASAAAKKKKKRRLWGDGKGSFRTKGSYSSATVRGTKWLVSDSCAGTLTRVVRGVVTVRDLVKHKTIRVRAGKRYLARAPG